MVLGDITHDEHPEPYNSILDHAMEQGALWELKIPTDRWLLHSDLPISRQPPAVQERIRECGLYDVAIKARLNGQQLYQLLGDQEFDIGIISDWKNSFTDRMDMSGPQVASSFLAEHGIRGIRSGTDDNPERIIFDPLDMMVLKQYSVADGNKIAGYTIGPRITLVASAIQKGMEMGVFLHEITHTGLQDMIGKQVYRSLKFSIEQDHQNSDRLVHAISKCTK